MVFKFQVIISILISTFVFVLLLFKAITPSEGLPLLSTVFSAWMNPPTKDNANIR